MRTPLIAGNWKMHKTIAEAVTLVQELRATLGNVEGCDVAVCPPAPALSADVLFHFPLGANEVVDRVSIRKHGIPRVAAVRLMVAEDVVPGAGFHTPMAFPILSPRAFRRIIDRVVTVEQPAAASCPPTVLVKTLPLQVKSFRARFAASAAAMQLIRVIVTAFSRGHRLELCQRRKVLGYGRLSHSALSAPGSCLSAGIRYESGIEGYVADARVPGHVYYAFDDHAFRGVENEGI